MIRLADCASRVVAISARQETGRIIAGSGDPPCGVAAPLSPPGAWYQAPAGRITCSERSSPTASASLHAMAGLKGKADG